MFGKKNRRRAASNPPLSGPTNPSAATAAAQAFLKNQASNASLSNAAAAAALRSRPTTPTSVADVQTKRTIRRTGSVSSVGSSVAGSTRGQPRPQLERRGSSASMTERTFREPSPSRPVPSAPDAPPVPALPTSLQQSPIIPPKSHRRASSVEAPATRVASPPPNKANGRGSSLGGATQPPRRTNQRMSNLSSVSESERPGSRGSVNFSLPTGSRPTSPVAQRRHRLTSPSPQRANMARIVSPTNQSLIYDPNTRSFLPEAQIMAIEERIHSASEQPVKKKKRASPIAGTHLADGTAGGRPKGTFIDAAEAAERQKAIETPAPSGQSAPAPVAAPVQAPAVELVPEAPKKKKKKVAISDSESDQASYIPNSSDNDSDFTTKQSNTRAVAPLAKKPSIVREDEERENEGNDTLKGTQNLAVLNGTPDSRQASPSPLPRSSVAGRGHGRGQASASTAFAQGRQKARSASQPAPKQDSPAKRVGSASRDSIRGGRVASVSPMRTTHFAPSPDSLIVKHDPPARSISPRKSAMKHSNSPHATFPNEGFHEHSFSETSNGSAVQSEGLTPRKKANRVSFDETNVVVGQAATPAASDSPIILSPQTKSKWFSIGRGKKKESAVSEDDEIMKPRPALPSFGSVREKKPVRDLEERPLVKPTEHSEAKLPPASPPLFTSPTGETIENPFGQSNDHGAGAVIVQDFASKNTANISKSREPLPPQVTSVDGNGEISGSDSSLYSVEDRKTDIGLARGNSIKRGPEDGNADTYRALASPVSHEFEAPTAKGESEAMNGINVPEINILSATPIIASAEPGQAWPDIPGSWAKENSNSSNQEQEEISLVEHHPTEPTVAEVGIAEPDPTTPRAGSPVLGEIAAYNSIAEEPEESDSSIYSDAAEDFSDIEGSGFMSLDAVVTTPVKINTEMTGLAISTPPESPTTQTTKQKAYQRSQLSRQSSEPDINQGWDKVQAYWSTLSAEKKRQLEEEARDEAEGSDTEVEAKPAPKPKKKKKVAVRAGTAQPEPDIQLPVSNDRSYMIQPGAKAGPNGHAPMKSSMRSEPANSAPEPHIRKSMRGSGSMRGTLREGAEPTGSLQKKNRPASQPPVSRPDPIEVQKHIRTLSAASAATAQSADTKRHTAPAPALHRKNSGDSDTSFKRSNKHGNEIPSFRNSMRGSVDSPQSAAPRPQSSRFSLRSLSPTGSAFRRPFNSGAAPQANLSETHMRNSMRSSNSITPSLRNNPPAKKSSGFGRSAPVKQNKQQKPTRRLISRFADSSDEDEETPRFQSRFNDSSDDDDGPPLPLPSAVRTMRNSTNAPVRGIPKRTGVNDGDSSDLPDSDDEKTPRLPKIVKNQNGISLNTTKASALASGSLRRSGSGRGTISAPPVALPGTDAPIRPNNPSRGSFMSILRRKKDTGGGGRVRKSDAESAARRDTPLERNKFDLQALRLESTQSPRLQKRNTMSGENSASWPLPGPGNGVSAHTGASQSQRVLVGKESEDARPFTADGPGGVVESPNGDLGANADGRPDIGSRRFTATGLANVDVANLSFAGANGGERKKKKFGKLRKMFRLDD
ncbi:related to MUC1 Extracellular alpha-1,4-glucan glucosidase [Rhynchosporium agropyri]|uniref:Related to MUC1 Extracellular alpha-1,4-glucan glucosidase n=1 Tax=Rhynchosporium agropyri TaxID=914238 RepID=A0A1E1LNR6_9HELO|nr:related to MUC1 Extracellular alpha-1,4-glucan glucosidase [Rhynchosporium agropyri]